MSLVPIFQPFLHPLVVPHEILVNHTAVCITLIKPGSGTQYSLNPAQSKSLKSVCATSDTNT